MANNTDGKVVIKDSTERVAIYNVYNRVTGERTLFYCANQVQAKKIFQKTANSQAINKAEEFELHFIGYWDKRDGSLIPNKKVVIVAIGYWEKDLDKELINLIDALVEKKMKDLKGDTNE